MGLKERLDGWLQRILSSEEEINLVERDLTRQRIEDGGEQPESNFVGVPPTMISGIDPVEIMLAINLAALERLRASQKNKN